MTNTIPALFWVLAAKNFVRGILYYQCLVVEILADPAAIKGNRYSSPEMAQHDATRLTELSVSGGYALVEQPRTLYLNREQVDQMAMVSEGSGWVPIPDDLAPLLAWTRQVADR